MNRLEDATMQKLTAGDAATQSADIVTSNIEQLQSLFPEAFTEGKVDFDVLKQLLGGAVDEREEKYGLNWHGKRRARQLALTPSTGTPRLLPVVRGAAHGGRGDALGRRGAPRGARTSMGLHLAVGAAKACRI